MTDIQELIPFLDPKGKRPDVKSLALQHILGLTGSKDGVGIIKRFANEGAKVNEESYNLFIYLFGLMDSTQQEAIAKDASLAIINLTADKDLATIVLRVSHDMAINFVSQLWTRIEDPASSLADPACMILSNLTHDSSCCSQVLKDLASARINFDRIVTIFCKDGYNAKGANLHYLGPFLSNLSQLREAREQLLDKDNPVIISRLLAFTEYPGSHVRRGGIIGTLRNCCFDTASHEWLLSEDNGIDILPRLLLPLAGPTPTDMDPEEVDKLPLDLQYLDDEKKIEEDPDLRKMLLEAILQLCATKAGREIIRLKNAYPILKELHKVEEYANVKLACENVVDLLIKKEGSGEITVDSFHDVDVPQEMVPELTKMDEEYLKDNM